MYCKIFNFDKDNWKLYEQPLVNYNVSKKILDFQEILSFGNKPL